MINRTRIIRWLVMFALIAVPYTQLSANIGQGEPLIKVGTASWYAEFSPGIKETTANMEHFDDSGLTCAMWDIEFNSVVKVTNLENGKSVYVRVNDRGPAKRLVREGRVIDLTRAAFRRIADLRQGLARVKVETV